MARFDTHKHESSRERQHRHAEDVERAKQKMQPLKKEIRRGFDVTAWEAMHREAENMTLFGFRWGN